MRFKINTDERSQYLLAFLMLFPLSCVHKEKQPAITQTSKRGQETSVSIKPGSSNTDTLVVDFAATIFYSPDPGQLEKIRTVTSSAAFETMLHENEYLVSNARKAIKNMHPALHIINTDHSRYLLFIKDDNRKVCIDLDAVKEPFGLLLFNRRMPPEFADMANIETSLNFYFRTYHDH